MDDKYIHIYGRHAVMTALTSRPDTVRVLYLRDDMKQQVAPELRQAAGITEIFSGKKLPLPIDEDAVHQGMMAKIDRYKLLMPYDTFKQDLVVTPDTAIAVLGEIQDPHNVGAVIRSAAAFGVQAILIPKHRQAGITGAVVKVSVGMAFTVPIVEVGNVNRALEDLKKAGCFVYGLAGEGSVSLHAEQFTKASVFVLGNEAEGLREKTREHCDTLLTIPMHTRCESLNASVSAAVTFAVWSAQHPRALKSV